VPVAPDLSLAERPTTRGRVKCVVWDLDDTLWHGVLLEDADVELRPGVVDVVRALDARGILQSIASRNDAETALEALRRFGIAEYFLYPQITWRAKSWSIKMIAESLRIGVEAIAFIDDQPFERLEVAAALPDVMVLDADALGVLLEMPELTPRVATDEARQRRAMYGAEQVRTAAESAFEGPSDAFLASLGMVFRISQATPEHVARAEELTVRTNQLNSTGRTYSFEQLGSMLDSPRHLVLVAGLDDRFGPYGTIGLAVVDREPDVWTIRLLLMSCRVMSRGVGTVLLGHIVERALAAGARVRADFVATGKNRLMLITYKFMGFTEVESRDGVTTFEYHGGAPTPVPSYLTVLTADHAAADVLQPN
jgi:FkbH-like protein